MAKRKTKIVPVREPSGRLARSTEEEINALPPATARRMRDAAARRMADPVWGSQLGRLFLEGKLSASQFEAGKRWGSLVRSWHRAIGAPKPYPGEGPIAFMGTVRAANVDDDPSLDTEEGKLLRRKRLALGSDMQQAHAVLIGAGMLAERAVRATCEDNEVPVGALGMMNLQCGLSWLSRHWGIGD